MSTILDLAGKTGTPRRPSSVEPIVSRVTLVTPMFIAGADNRAQRSERRQVVQEMVPSRAVETEGLRSASVKAAIRFWWRAGFDPQRGLDAMLRDEAELFGAIAGGQDRHQGQGLVVRTRVLNGWTAEPPKEIGGPCRELSYLAYGCADLNGPLRPAIVAGAQAEIALLARKAVHRSAAEQALERWMLFGNLGAKSRRGWGSVTDGRWSDGAALAAAIGKHLQTGGSTAPLWSSLHGAEVLLKDLGNGPWSSALNELGRLFHQFRKDLGADIIRFNPKEYTRPPGKDHNRVHSWLKGGGMRDGKAGDTSDTLPDRAGFGLPYPLQFSSLDNAKVSMEPAFDKEGGRRASPVVFKVHCCNGRWWGMATILAGQFLPDRVEVRVATRGKKTSLPIAKRPPVLAVFSTYLQSNGFTRIIP